MSGRRILL